MKKALILFLYGVALYFILRRYYQTESGLPKPNVLVAPTYLYGILALASDFMEGFPIVIAAAVTVAFIWQVQGTATTATTTKTKTQKKAS